MDAHGPSRGAGITGSDGPVKASPIVRRYRGALHGIQVHHVDEASQDLHMSTQTVLQSIWFLWFLDSPLSWMARLILNGLVRYLCTHGLLIGGMQSESLAVLATFRPHVRLPAARADCEAEFTRLGTYPAPLTIHDAIVVVASNQHRKVLHCDDVTRGRGWPIAVVGLRKEIHLRWVILYLRMQASEGVRDLFWYPRMRRPYQA